MTVENIAVVATNAVIVLTGVWRMSGLLSKIETQLAQVIKDHDKDGEAFNTRLNGHEARILNLERSKGAL